MLINRDQRGPALFFAVVTAAATAWYWHYSTTALYGPTGGSWDGLAYGTAGLALMLLAAFLSIRKRFRTRRIGSARGWMSLHLWGGLASVPLILFHSGFALGGPLTTILMILFAVVIVSGIVGIALQQVIPRRMTELLPAETLVTQIAHVRERLAADAYDLVASVTGAIAESTEEQAWLDAEKKAGWKAVARRGAASAPADGADALRGLYLGHVRPYLRRKPGARIPLPNLAEAATDLPPELLPHIEQLRTLCDESRQLDVQLRLHATLHNWLFVHAPLSIALFVLVAFHIWYALKY